MGTVKKYLMLTAMIFCIANNIVAQKKEVVYHFPADTSVINTSLPDYVDLTDGRMIEGKIMDLNLIKKNVYDKITGTLIVEGIEYDMKDVKGFQYKGVYFSRAESKKHMIVRLKHGKINLYSAKMDGEKYSDRGFVESRWVHTRHLIQKGENGGIEIFSIKELEKYVSDYQPALDLIKRYWENKSSIDSDKYLEQAIDVYNSSR
jgi:hypothetical protein